MGDVNQTVANLFPPTEGEKQWIVPSATPPEPVLPEAVHVEPVSLEPLPLIAEAVHDSVKEHHDHLLSRLAECAAGRTEDNIGLEEDYWKVLNQLRMHIHNNK